MRRVSIGAVLAFALTCLASASAPVASLTSTHAITLDGLSLSAVGIATWPLVIGDEVGTSGAFGTITFNDGSRIVLASQSLMKIVGTSAEPKIVLIAGSLDYKLVASSKISVTNSRAALEQAKSENVPTYSVTATAKAHRLNAPLLLAAASAGVAAPIVLITAHRQGASGGVSSNNLVPRAGSITPAVLPAPPPKSIHR